MSNSDPINPQDETLADEALIQAVMAQAQPTEFEIALLGHIKRLETRLETALNDLSALHAGKKRRILLDNQDEPPTVLQLKFHIDGEDETPTLH